MVEDHNLAATLHKGPDRRYLLLGHARVVGKDREFVVAQCPRDHVFIGDGGGHDAHIGQQTGHGVGHLLDGTRLRVAPPHAEGPQDDGAALAVRDQIIHGNEADTLAATPARQPDGIHLVPARGPVFGAEGRAGDVDGVPAFAPQRHARGVPAIAGVGRG